MKTMAKALAQTHETTRFGLALFSLWMAGAVLLIVG
jgi:hypothetical protein